MREEPAPALVSLRDAQLRRGAQGAAFSEARGELVVCDEIDLCDLVFYDQARAPAGAARGAT